MIKIFNDDCIKILKKIKTESIDCCVTDCPYKIISWWVRIIDKWNECGWVLSKRNKTDSKSEWDIISDVKKWKIFSHNDLSFSDWLPDLYRVMKPWTHTYIMVNARNLAELQNEAEWCANTEEEKDKLRKWKRIKRKWFLFQNLLVWKKWNFTPNKYYMQGAEFILMLRKWPARSINDMWSPNIIDIPNIIWKKRHPTEKPAELFETMLRNSTNKWNWILDPFAGCWPIIEAWKKLELNVVAIEIDKEYFTIANNRI